MTDAATANVYRPSPRPRPDGAPPRPDSPRLHVVTDQTEITETATAGTPPSAEDPQVSDLSAFADAETATGAEARIRAFGASTAAYWTPPAVYTDRPASLAELAAYAKQAPWTHQQTGIIRGLGVAYYRGVAYPYTVISRYREWFAQRPGRLLVLFGGVKLAAMTGPGIWAVDHLVYPAARIAGHVFL